eukprot:360692-Chlamydomonas_euryale.AAC.2
MDAGGVFRPRTLASPPTAANTVIGTARVVGAVGTIGGAAAAPRKEFVSTVCKGQARKRAL